MIWITLRRIGSFLKCFIVGHDWEKDRSGFNPIKGTYFRTWTCKRCHVIEMREYTLL